MTIVDTGEELGVTPFQSLLLDQVLSIDASVYWVVSAGDTALVTPRRNSS